MAISYAQVGSGNEMIINSRNGTINCEQKERQNYMDLNMDRSHELPEDTKVDIRIVHRKTDGSKVETCITINDPAAEESVNRAAHNRGVWRSLQEFFNTLYASLERVYRGSVVIELKVTDANFLHCVEKAAKEGRLSELILQLLQEESVFETIKGQKLEITVEVRIPEGQYEEMSKKMDRKKEKARELVEDLLTKSREEEVVQRQSVKGLDDAAEEVGILGATLSNAMIAGVAVGTIALLAAPFTMGASLGVGAVTIAVLISAFLSKVTNSNVRQSTEKSLINYNHAVSSLEKSISDLLNEDEVMKDMVESAFIERLNVEPIQISNIMISLKQPTGSASELVFDLGGSEIPLTNFNLLNFIIEMVRNQRRPPSEVQVKISDLARQMERMDVNPFRDLLSSA
ncbi:uncharacterized protein [Haliotis cracherodii]|uniref:uncharacterized protein n=1 Tax=Haliotis cracherodii TaxID=6455 RepID=UPI0039E7AC34